MALVFFVQEAIATHGVTDFGWPLTFFFARSGRKRFRKQIKKHQLLIKKIACEIWLLFQFQRFAGRWRDSESESERESESEERGEEEKRRSSGEEAGQE